MNIIAENIARRRKELGMTQKELAEKLNISDKTLSRWETDKQVPDALMIPEIAQALEMSIHELYGISENVKEYDSKYTSEGQRSQPDSGKISIYKIALLAGMFFCAIGGWIYFYWLGNYARYGAVMLLLIGIMAVLFAEIAFEESCLKNDDSGEYEKIHTQWFGSVLPVMGLIVGVIFPILKPAGMALFHSWDMILPIVMLQLVVFGLYLKNNRRLRDSGKEFRKSGMVLVSVCAGIGMIGFLAYTIYSFWNPYINAQSIAAHYDEWVQEGGWIISRMLEVGTGIAFLGMNFFYSQKILGIFKQNDEKTDNFKKVFRKAIKIVVTTLIVMSIIVVPVVVTINRTLNRYVRSVSGMVPYEEIMAYEPDLIGWIHECNRSGNEVNALQKTTFVQETGKYGDAYLFYFPHGGELSETEVTYKIGTAGKTLNVKMENSTTIMGNAYYFCYVEVSNDMKGIRELRTWFDGEKMGCEPEHTNLNIEVFEY